MERVEDLYYKYKDDVYRYALSLSKDSYLAEELVQETFLRALKGILAFKGQSSLKTWLFSICRNSYFEMMRNKKDFYNLDDFYDLEGGENIEAKALERDLLALIEDYLVDKGDKKEKIYYMRLGGYSYYEIGEELKISESSARVSFFRLKKVIKGRLEE